MNLNQIKEALNKGERVYWVNDLYEVIKDDLGQYFIKCSSNNSCVGLTHKDGKTMNGEPKDFFIQ